MSRTPLDPNGLRELYAALAMHALLSREDLTDTFESESEVAAAAIAYADALIEELAK